MPFEKSAGAIVFWRKKGEIYYLLLHYEMGHWEFAKGNIEKGETLEDTVKREVKEESGIENIKFVDGFKEHIKYFYKLKGKNIFKIVTFFLTEAKSPKVKLSWEHKGFKWLPYQKAIEQLTFKNSKEILKKANEFLIKHENIKKTR